MSSVDPSIEEVVMSSLGQGAKGVGNVAHHMYHTRFACQKKGRKAIWYELCEDRWVEVPDGWKLRAAFSRDIPKLNDRLASKVSRAAGQEEDVSIARKMNKERDKLFSVYIKLQDVHYVDRVMKQCADRFNMEGIMGETKRPCVELAREEAWSLDTYHRVVEWLRGVNGIKETSLLL